MDGRELDRRSEMFRALANPNRLRIFLRLASCCGGGACIATEEIGAYVGDLGRELEVVPSTVSHHIRELERAGLIKISRRGQHVLCCTDPETVRDLAKFFGGLAPE